MHYYLTGLKLGLADTSKEFASLEPILFLIYIDDLDTGVMS